jgi:hypothetical protein
MPAKEPDAKEPDKVQREIEELLERLDNFVPEERLAAKIRSRRKQSRRTEPAGPGPLDGLRKRLSRVTLGQVMLVGLGCMLIGWILDGSIATWLTLAGIVLTVGAFVMSLINGGGSRATIGGRVQKRWRGQVIEYGEPSTVDRVRGWFRRRGRR